MNFRRYLLILFCFIMATAMMAKRIVKVAPVQVSCSAGCVPTLPFQLLVTYSDGTQQWRQVRWSNSQTTIEHQQAEMPVGANYTITGHIIGDNSTRYGYPVEAQVSVTESNDNARPAVIAEPLPLSAVRLTGNNILSNNRDRDIEHLLSLDITQQLYNYRDTYGLPTEGYTTSDGWDSPTTKLKGHGTGHYLSALAMAFASATQQAQRDSLRSRMARMVDELRMCQERTFVWSDSLGRYFEARDLAPEAELTTLGGTWKDFNHYKQDWAHYGYGYLNAIPAQHPILIEAYRAYNNDQWVWAPYYTIHKQLAGLIDIATHVDDPIISKKALQIATDMGLWVWNRLHYRTYADAQAGKKRPGNRYEMWNMYIAGEVGGMSESLARLSEMTSDKQQKERLIEASNYFDAPAFYTPLSHNIDDIRTRHANQHIPMITGALRSYRSNGNDTYYNIARNFWHLIQGRYAYSTGGVGNGEMFRQPYTQMLAMTTHGNAEINETCCAYNLAKLTKELNCYTPDDASLMDYYERVLMNQIVGSLAPNRWACTYQYAVGLNGQKPYGNETPQSTCCGGTGVENHVKYQEAAYFVNDTCLWVSLYMPTQVDYPGVQFTQQCEYPAEATTITFDADSKPMTIKLRVPYWATERFEVKVNGEIIIQQPQPCSYVSLPCRVWKRGDKIEISMPYTTHLWFGPDKMEIAKEGDSQKSYPAEWLATVMCGPLAMATGDIRTWDESEMTLKENLSDLHRAANQGTLPAVELHSHTFLPDYAYSTPSTRYLRLHVESKQKGKKVKLDTSELQSAISMGQERKANADQWAPHGMKRMLNALTQAEQHIKSKKMTQREADALTSELNMHINAMRPANLAEEEDLAELQQLLHSKRHTATQEDIRYAEMVIRYVRNGSGTHDMIKKAIEQLNKQQISTHK